MSRPRSIELEPCTPPLWARGGHLQTIVAHLWKSAPLETGGKRIEIIQPDGDKLIGEHHERGSDAVVYVFHGLGGSTEADYMHRTARSAMKYGASVVLMNHRGCGAGAGLARRPYHSGSAEDVSATIRWGRERYPKARHVAVGFSLSANALLLLLSGARGDTLPDAAVAVNGPIDLMNASKLLTRGFNRLYDFRFVRRCRAELRARGVSMQIPWHSTVHEIDELYTAPAGGFRDRADYYATCSTKPRLKNIRTPTYVLTAKDDPFVDSRDYLQAELSPSVHMHIESTGGHMGYFSARPTVLGTHFWMDYALDTYLRELLS